VLVAVLVPGLIIVVRILARLHRCPPLSWLAALTPRALAMIAVVCVQVLVWILVIKVVIYGD
jgi:hypothetical protein